MKNKKIIDIPGILIALITFAVSFYILYSDTAMLFNCIFASLMAAVMLWGTYLTIRMCILSARDDE